MSLIEKINDCRPSLSDLDESSIIFPKKLKKKIKSYSHQSGKPPYLGSIRGLVGEYFVSNWISLVPGFNNFYVAKDLNSKINTFKNSNCVGIDIYNGTGKDHISEIDGLVNICQSDFILEVKTCRCEFINPFISNKINPNLDAFSKVLGNKDLSYLLFLSKSICDVSDLRGNLSKCDIIDLDFSEKEILDYCFGVIDFLKSK